jgi:hypothetical protein
MKLITEEAESVQVITEEKNGVKKLFIEGVFLQGDTVNRNKRLYEMKVLRNAVKAYNENFVQKGRSVGELGHPANPAINLDRVSHKIISLKENGKNFIGKAQILDTPMGKIAQNLYEAGVQLGVSSRGLGSLRPTDKGYSVVSEDFTLSTAADIVHDPSAPDAFVSGLMENVEWLYDTKRQEYVASSIRNKIEKDVVSRRLTEERKLLHFENYLRLI